VGVGDIADEFLQKQAGFDGRRAMVIGVFQIGYLGGVPFL